MDEYALYSNSAFSTAAMGRTFSPNASRGAVSAVQHVQLFRR